MAIALIAGSVIAVALACLALTPLSRTILIAAGVFVIVVGCSAIAALEWRYAPANTMPVQMPVVLDRAGQIETQPFRLALSGPYQIWLEFDHAPDGVLFDCLTGTPGFEAACPKADPVLDLVWSVTESGHPVARWATDWSNWHAKQAALPPAAAIAAQTRYRNFLARSQDPSNNWPLSYEAGSFDGVAGRTYVVNLFVRRAGGALVALHPRIKVGLGSAATKGLGTMVLLFSLLCVVCGGILLLTAIRRRGANA